MTIETDIITQIAEKYNHFGEADLRHIVEQGGDNEIAALVTHIRALAASALGKHEGLGLEVSLIDVFGAWGEREARDTAMLIDLCLGAAIEQLGGTAVRIEAARMEALAGKGRIVRLQPEPNVWSVALVPTEDSPVDYARAIEYSRGFEDGELALDFFEAIYADHGVAPTYKQVAMKGFPGFFEWVMEAFQNPPVESSPEK